MAITKIQSESLNLADTYAFTGTVTGAGETLKPAFSAYLSANQSVTNATITKANFDTEIYDSGGVFDTTNNRFTPGVTGKYLINAGLEINSAFDGNFSRGFIYLREDGSTIRELACDHRGNATRMNNLSFSFIIDVDSTSHYYEVFGYMSALNDGSGVQFKGTSEKSYFNAFKLF